MAPTGFAPQTAIEGRYLLDAPVDGWGLGEAWQARDKNFRGRAVIVEFFAVDRADRLAELTQEVRAQRSLKHPCVLPVINQGTHAGHPWVAYDGFDGVPLARFLEDQRRARAQVELGAVKDIFEKVLDGITAAHEAATPVVHGALHPQCVLVKQGGLKLVDFNLGPLAPDGSLGLFRAPELAAAGEVAGIASEVYALGVLLAEMLLPQTIGDPRKALEGFLTTVARDGGAQAGRMQRNDVPAAVWEVIARAVKRDAPTRWEDVSAMRAALTAAWSSTVSAGPSHARAATMAPMPPPFAPLTAPAPAPLPVAAFSGTMPPLSSPMPALPPLPPPAAAFSGPNPFTSAAASAMPMPPVPPPRPNLPSTQNVAEAWATLKPAGQSKMQAALASAWDPVAPPLPGPPPAALASAWDVGHASASWEPPAPVAGAHASADNDWDEQTSAAAPHPAHSPMAIAPAIASKLAGVSQESTMALDVDSLSAAIGGRAPPPTPSPPEGLDDDWKDSVVVLNTSGVTVTGMPYDAAPEEATEVGSRNRMGGIAPQAFDSMETVRPMQRPAALDAFMPGFAPSAPPVSERTMALDTMSGAHPVAPTVAAPMMMQQAPRVMRPSQPVVAQAPPQSSNTPIIIALVVALVFIVGAVLVVLMRR